MAILYFGGVAVEGGEEGVHHDLGEGAAVGALLSEPLEGAVGLAAKRVDAGDVVVRVLRRLARRNTT